MRLLTGWGRTAPTRARVSSAGTADEVVSRMAGAGARGVIARGLGRSYGDAAQNAGGTVVCYSGGRSLELDPETGLCTADAGVSLDELMRFSIPLGWFPMVMPGTRFVTIGGAVGFDIHGKSRQGSFGTYIDRMQLVTPADGPCEISPMTRPDVFRATVGGMGLTGVVTEATIQLQRIETSLIVADTERTADIDDCMARMVDGDDRYQYSVAWIDCVSSGAHLGRGVLSRGSHARVDQLPARAASHPLEFDPRSRLSAPAWCPNHLMNGRTVRAFNELWFRKAPRERRDELTKMTSFFHPLDGLTGWNRVAGSRGFVQYQFLVPYGAEHVVRAVLERLGAAGCTSFLASLKRLDHDSPGLMGFPMAGWTLALDIPTTSGSALDKLLDELDELVVTAGGRLYLAKDSRLRPELLSAMYPHLAEWRAIRGAVDPDHTLRSDMDRRLSLTGDGR